MFCGKISSVRHVVKLLQAATPVSGLLVKLDKCEAFSRNSLDTLNDDIRKSAVPNMDPILGAPIGSSEFCRDFASRKRDKACELLRALPFSCKIHKSPSPSFGGAQGSVVSRTSPEPLP